MLPPHLARANVVRPALVLVLVNELEASPRVLEMGRVAAGALVAHVLRLRLVEAAPAHVVSQHRDVAPRRRVPVRVVIALLRALETAPGAAGVLPRVDRPVAVACIRRARLTEQHTHICTHTRVHTHARVTKVELYIFLRVGFCRYGVATVSRID